MKKLLTILFLIPFLAQADGLVQWYFVGHAEYTVYMTTGPEGGRHYTEYSDLGSLPVPIAVRFWSNYTWSTGIGDINITNANIGATLHGGDTVFIPNTVTYRSVSMSDIGTISEGSYITIWAPGVNITPHSGGNLFANSFDSCNWVHLYGISMKDHTDPLFSYHGTTGHSHYMWFDSITLRRIPAFFINGDPVTSLPNWTGGAYDTINMFYHFKFRKLSIDSVGDAVNGGLTSLWIGGMEKNNVWYDVDIDQPSMDTNYSSNAPAEQIHLANAYYVRIHDGYFAHMGVVAHPVGHAAVIGCQESQWYVYRNKFYKNFGNCVRAISQGFPPALIPLTLTKDPTFDQICRFNNNIDDSSVKYPMIEDQMDTLYQSPLLPYYQFKRSAKVYNNTMYSPGCGALNSAYDACVYDFYAGGLATDTMEMVNNMETGPVNDSTSVGNAFFALCKFPNGVFGTFFDTSHNSFWQASVLATSGLANSTTFSISNTGILYNTGTTTPVWLTLDFYKNAIPSGGRSPGYDIGAVQYPATIPPTIKITIGSGALNITNHH